MGGHPNVLRTDQSVSLEEFVRRFIATPSDLDRLTELGRPNGPKTVSKPDLNVGSGRIFDPNPVTYSTGVTPEFVEQRKLSQRLQSENSRGLRQRRLAGNWTSCRRVRTHCDPPPTLAVARDQFGKLDGRGPIRKHIGSKRERTVAKPCVATQRAMSLHSQSKLLL
jgi:hypothetical protein